MELPANLRGAVEELPFPEWTDPMLAVLHGGDPFSDPDWIFERKLDGVRCLIFKDSEGVQLMSRNRKELNQTYPELLEAVQRQSGRFIADGEIVAFSGKVTSFSRLQKRIQIKDPDRARQTGVSVYLYLFDLIYLDRFDLSSLPLRSRKKLLRQSFDWKDPIRFTSHRNEKGKEYFQEACQKGWEGLIAKDATSHYVHGRSRKWLKIKCRNRQELVVGGWTDPKGERTGLGALLVGYYDEGALVYAGKVGTGYDQETLQHLSEKLRRRARKTPPFDQPGDLRVKGAHWVTPDLVAEIAFTEWTSDGKLRHPAYIGLRTDKDARNVTREKPGS